MNDKHWSASVAEHIQKKIWQRLLSNANKFICHNIFVNKICIFCQEFLHMLKINSVDTFKQYVFDCKVKVPIHLNDLKRMDELIYLLIFETHLLTSL